MKYLGLLWANLRRRPLRVILAFGCIFVAFLLFGLLAAVQQAFDAGVSLAGNDRLVVRHKVSLIQLLPVSYKERIGRIEGVSVASHQTWFGGVYQDPKNFFARIAVEPEEFLQSYPEYQVPEDQQAAWQRTRRGAVAGRVLAERYGWEVGDIVPIMGTIWRKQDASAWEFELVGIYDSDDKNTDLTGFFFHYDYLDEVSGGPGLAGWYVVTVDEPERSEEIAEQIDAMFANSSAETSTATELAFVQAFAKQIGDIGAIVRAVLSVVFFLLLLVVGNTMAQAVRERTNELAVLKAIGFTDAGVLAMVLAESCLLAVLGGGLGLLTAWVLTLGGDPTGGALPVFYIPAQKLVLGGVLVLVFGVVIGLVPGLQAKRLQVAEALRRD